MNLIKKLLVGAGVAGVSVAAHADLDLAPITAAVSVGTIAVAMIALGAIKMGPNVAKWAANKLASFF